MPHMQASSCPRHTCPQHEVRESGWSIVIARNSTLAVGHGRRTVKDLSIGLSLLLLALLLLLVTDVITVVLTPISAPFVFLFCTTPPSRCTTASTRAARSCSCTADTGSLLRPALSMVEEMGEGNR
eukprot:4456118-Pleurochrysis_carterae.AAC.2